MGYHNIACCISEMLLFLFENVPDHCQYIQGQTAWLDGGMGGWGKRAGRISREHNTLWAFVGLWIGGHRCCVSSFRNKKSLHIACHFANVECKESPMSHVKFKKSLYCCVTPIQFEHITILVTIVEAEFVLSDMTLR